ncbi:SAM-dependent methyltransferase [Roseibium sp. FZY0029]|uniref:SAM-dependent methyltransferase n=1 Tax=Roseibium sp. FZY0029 TaxID=3116647 RepID=UPI002EB8B98A|nr:SAM-dependent methyltransferase [Roseibium sp. FZY0029]
MSKLTKFISGYENDGFSLGKSARKKRIQYFCELIENVFREKGSVKILDIGGTVQYWRILDEDFLDRNNVHITLLNLPGSQAFEAVGRFDFLTGDATDDIWSQLNQQDYDLIHSNSVIEHVGDWAQMRKFASNIKHFHGGYFVQTPNFWFPVEPHCMTLFFHWLPKPLRVWLVAHFSLGHWDKGANTDEAVEIVESARLLSKSMFKALFDDALIKQEKFLFLTKSFMGIRLDGGEASS